MKKNAAQKGYTLVIVLFICIFMAMTTLATFSVVLRYSYLSKQQIDTLQAEINPSAITEATE